MSYEVKHTLEERELIETPDGLVSAPRQKPYIILLAGFALKYVPDETDRSLSGWEIVPVDTGSIKETFGLCDEDLDLRPMEKPIEFGPDKLLRVPKMFTIVSHQAICRMVPRWDFWVKASAPEGSKMPILHIERDEYPLIMEEKGEILVVPIKDVNFYEEK